MQTGLRDPKSFAIWRNGASPLRATAMTSARNSAGNGFGTRLTLLSEGESSQVTSHANWGQSQLFSWLSNLVRAAFLGWLAGTVGHPPQMSFQ